MKPVVSVINAWSCIVISIFAIVILGVLAILFATDHHSMMDSGEDPENGKTVAATCLGAILVYAGFLVFCGSQAWLHKRQSRGGEVRLS